MRFTNSDLLSSLSNRIFHLILMPTEACNFRCVYCYEDFKYKRMEPWVVRGVKGLLARRAPGLGSLTLSWFGGEPTLARDLIEEVMLHARSLAAENPALRVASDMTTNGYLLSPPVFARFVELGIDHYQISFDGPRDWHDRKRVTAGGKGTYDRIWSNMVAMREAKGDFTIMVRVHADKSNADAIPQFIDEYKRDFGSDPKFELFIRSLSRLGGANDRNLEVFERAEAVRIIEDLRALARSRGVKLAEMAGGVPICYAARANSFVVRANGRLNKCTVALEHPNNQVGSIHEDGTVEIRPEPMAMWMRGLRSEVPEELKCPMHGFAEAMSSSGDGGRVPIPLELARAAGQA